MTQSLSDFSLHLYALDDRVWAEITCKLVTVCNELDAARCYLQIRGIVARTVIILFSYFLCSAHVSHGHYYNGIFAMKIVKLVQVSKSSLLLDQF